MGLVFLISHFFITKTAPANKWMRKKIPFCSNSALVILILYSRIPYSRILKGFLWGIFEEFQPKQDDFQFLLSDKVYKVDKSLGSQFYRK